MRFSANVSILFKEAPFLERFAWIPKDLRGRDVSVRDPEL